MKLSEKIRVAREDHAREYPDGDWKSANDRLEALWYECLPIFFANGLDPYRGGNEGRIEQLEAIGL